MGSGQQKRGIFVNVRKEQRETFCHIEHNTHTAHTTAQWFLSGCKF